LFPAKAVFSAESQPWSECGFHPVGTSGLRLIRSRSAGNASAWTAATAECAAGPRSARIPGISDAGEVPPVSPVPVKCQRPRGNRPPPRQRARRFRAPSSSRTSFAGEPKVPAIRGRASVLRTRSGAQCTTPFNRATSSQQRDVIAVGQPRGPVEPTSDLWTDRLSHQLGYVLTHENRDGVLGAARLNATTRAKIQRPPDRCAAIGRHGRPVLARPRAPAGPLRERSPRSWCPNERSRGQGGTVGLCPLFEVVAMCP
jgi:hypothetical protein